MRRREFITLLGRTAVAWPLAVRAQQPAMPVIGFLSARSPGETTNLVSAFRQGLREAGFIEGQNVIVAFRWAEGHYDKLPALATELVDLRVAVLFASGGTPAAFAAKAVTQTIPVVFSAANDPVGVGLVASLNRPGGNITGMSFTTPEMVAKSTQLLKELVPGAGIIAYLMNPSSPAAELFRKEAERDAAVLGIKVRVLNASTEHDLDEDFASLTQIGAVGLVVPADSFLDNHRDQIVALSARYRIAAIFTIRETVLTGGLMSYGPSLPDSYRRAAIYVGRILKGDKPADLPVMQPEKYELVINLKTAKMLGLAVPDKLLATADEVIE
jgi:putative tryptophan/tyrosine transport system substrate-binding protein